MNEQSKTILLNHDRTESEEYFELDLFLFLRRTGYSGEVHKRSFLANQKGQARRPDFYFPRYALAIEIDGPSRASWTTRISDESPRDKFYESIGARPPLIIQSTDVVSTSKMARFKTEFLGFLYEERLTPREQSAINKRIHDGRLIYEAKHPGIFDSSGGQACQFNPLLEANGFHEFRHFGGTRLIFRKPYGKRASSFFPDFDLSPEGMMKELERRRLLKSLGQWE